MGNFHLSQMAASDLEQLDLQTIEQFGLTAAEALLDNFLVTFRRLAANPRLGRIRTDLSPPGYEFRSWIVKNRFAVIYRSSDTGIEVARILDGVRDLPVLLEENPGDSPPSQESDF